MPIYQVLEHIPILQQWIGDVYEINGKTYDTCNTNKLKRCKTTTRVYYRPSHISSAVAFRIPSDKQWKEQKYLFKNLIV